MVKGSELIDQALMKSNGHLTGYRVKRNLYLNRKLELGAFQLYNIENKKEEDKYIFYKRIKNITQKGLEIYSENDIIHHFQMPTLESALKKVIHVIGFEIYNESKDLMGVVKDTVINKKTGKIMALLVSEGYFDDLINGYAILPLNEKIKLEKHNIIFNSEDIRSISHNSGGLKKLLGIEPPN
ncbi:hypothetical protein Amet_2455 [Alkaliphilus metalliredigens QYMF]|uniref:PRC-barrel domain-containing protein n=2 Tax=Alkaliphilus TaxID=114627 RepID=A6TQZ1_ALKMQ|nr:hypothetical protein Amet_2455 [Alkaliphilus metalliredigens QYMF]